MPEPDIAIELLQKYSGEYPRYTSYPTAPHFSTRFGESTYRKHAYESNGELLPRDLSLYIHIPFCHSLCYFCGCNKVVTRCSHTKVNDYVSALKLEIEQRAQLFDADRQVRQIHFGGGTPNFLEPRQLADILHQIQNKFTLSPAAELEIGIELDPRSIAPDGVAELARVGFNRFSIGVQDFSPDVQLAINRVQSERKTLEVINAACRVSESVNVDLITGLPSQTVHGFKDTLGKIISSGTSRIAAYNFAYLPQRIKAQRLIKAEHLPSLEQRFAIVQCTRDFLNEAGFTHIGMDHFGRPDDSLVKAYHQNTLQRNFQGYTTFADTDLVGLGASAISQFKNSFAQNSTELSNYIRSVKTGRLPISRGVELTEDDRVRAAMIQQLMCHNRVSLSQPLSSFMGTSDNTPLLHYFEHELSRLNPFIDDQLVRVNNDMLIISHTGRYFRRQLAAQFDAFFFNHNLQQSNNVVPFSQAL